jgi:GAF domain-containing protein
VSDDATGASHPTEPRTFDQAGVMGIVARERRSINVPDVRCEGRFLAPEWFRANGFTSCYGIPVVADGSVLAVLNFNGHAPFVFRSSDAEALRAFVTQAATAIRNAWRYEDVTIAHRRLAESQAQLVHSEKLSALGQLVAGVAHELNNPLAAMLGYAYLAELKDDAATLSGTSERCGSAPNGRRRSSATCSSLPARRRRRARTST